MWEKEPVQYQIIAIWGASPVQLVSKPWFVNAGLTLSIVKFQCQVDLPHDYSHIQKMLMGRLWRKYVAGVLAFVQPGSLQEETAMSGQSPGMPHIPP